MKLSLFGKRAALASLLSLSLFGAANAQLLKPGFDWDEYVECLCMASHMDSIYVDGVGASPMPAKFHKVYASPVVGFDNQWELWQDNRGLPAILLRATVPTMASWGANFNAGMVPAVGRAFVGREVSYDFCADSTALIHSGWTAGLLTMTDDILAKIDSCYALGHKEFLIAGHSQGGALSYLFTAFARRAMANGLLPADITFKTYSSAAPKVGDYLFALHYEAATQGGWAFSVVNPEDWVPETPLSIQRPTDFRPTNPLSSAADLVAGSGPKERLKMRFLYNRINKPASAAAKNCSKYLGGVIGSMLADEFKWYRAPVLVESSYFVRAGHFVVLMPDAEYYAKHPKKSAHKFEHHDFIAYYELAQRMREKK